MKKSKSFFTLCLICLLALQTSVFASSSDFDDDRNTTIITAEPLLTDDDERDVNLWVSTPVQLTTSYQLALSDKNIIKANVKISNTATPYTLSYKIVDSKGNTYTGSIAPSSNTTVYGIPAGQYEVYLKGSVVGTYYIIITDWL